MIIEKRVNTFRLWMMLLAICCVANACVIAQKNPIPTGRELINQQKIKTTAYEKEGFGSIKSNRNDGVFTIETVTQPKFIYNLSTRLPIEQSRLEKGEILLLSFEGKTEYASLETGEARLQWQFDLTGNRKQKERATLSMSSDWQQYYVPIEVKENSPSGVLSVAMQFGYPPQKMLLKNLSLKLYPSSVDINQLPKTQVTYIGMEVNAAWRATALERIEQHRKTDIQLHFTQNGAAVEGLPVQIRQLDHHFKWGAAVAAKRIVKEENYLDRCSQLFNLVVFENDLKIKKWQNQLDHTDVLNAIDSLSKKGIGIKGHVLIWPGFRHLTPQIKANKNNPEVVQELVETHVDDILATTHGKVSRWDVVNETYTNKDLQKITGSEEILVNGFKTLAKQDPNVLRYTNEFGIINRGGINKQKQEWYYDFIKRMDEQSGGLVDGIGIQSHIGSDLTPPVKVLSILDYYATLDKTISISEFTMDIKDLVVRKQYTKDFIIAAFSHPSVNEFLFWGVDTEKADIFDEKGGLGSMGEAFFELVYQEWQSNSRSFTDKLGSVSQRVFYGTYEYSYDDNGVIKTGTFTIIPNGQTTIQIEL